MKAKINRRIARLAAAIAAGMLAFSGAQAAASLAKTQAPGYYRMMLGDFEITALNDATFQLSPAALLTNVKPEQVRQALERNLLKDPVPTSVNGFLVNTGTKLVLIDTGTGTGDHPDPTMGALLANLRAAGYQPGQVDEIYITHMHGDHIGGLTAAGHAAFPNAIVRADRREADYWLSEANLNAAAKDAQERFRQARAALAPYIAAGRFRTFDGATELVPGVRAQSAYGHTPGHTVYEVASKGEKLLLWGDLMHVAAVQFADPAVTIRFDTDSPAAARQRALIFTDAARQGYWIGGAHVAFPGLGQLTAAGAGYTWLPVIWQPLH